MTKRNIPKTRLAENLRIARKKKGYTLKELNDILNDELPGKGYGWTVLREWEVGTCEPPIYIVFSLADILDIPIAKLVGWPYCKSDNKEE